MQLNRRVEFVPCVVDALRRLQLARSLCRILLALVSVMIMQHKAQAQNSSATVWNDYSGGSSSALITYNGNDPTTGSPKLYVTIGSESDGGSGVLLQTATMDTGSTGALISITQACEGGVIACTGTGPTNYAPASQAQVLGYGEIGYSSSGIYYSGFYADAKVSIGSGSGAHTTEAISSVPVFIATSIAGQTQAAGPAPTGLGQFGVGFGRTANATGKALTNEAGVANGVVLYGTQLNPLLNLTKVDINGQLTSNLSSLAPGYVVTRSGGSTLGSPLPTLAAPRPWCSWQVKPRMVRRPRCRPTPRLPRRRIGSRRRSPCILRRMPPRPHSTAPIMDLCWSIRGSGTPTSILAWLVTRSTRRSPAPRPPPIWVSHWRASPPRAAASRDSSSMFSRAFAPAEQGAAPTVFRTTAMPRPRWCLSIRRARRIRRTIR